MMMNPWIEATDVEITDWFRATSEVSDHAHAAAMQFRANREFREQSAREARKRNLVIAVRNKAKEAAVVMGWSKE